MLENQRKNSVSQKSVISQAVTTLGRNELLSSAYSDLLPELSPADIGYLTRLTTDYLEGNLNLENVSVDIARETILQKIRREKPEFYNAAKIADLVIDIHLQYARK